MKRLSWILIISGLLQAEFLDYAVLDKHYLLPKPTILDIVFHYNVMNDTIDLFNLKEEETKNINPTFGALGDMHGIGVKLRYGLSDRWAFFAAAEIDQLDYASENLINQRLEIWVKYALPKALSLDLGFSHDHADEVDIKNEAMLNAMLRKLFPSHNVSIKDGTLYTQDSSVSLYDTNGKKIHPYVSVADAQDDSFYAHVTSGFYLSRKSLVDFYVGLKSTSSRSQIQIKPLNNEYIQAALSEYSAKMKLLRSEMSYYAGMAFAISLFQKSFFEINYQYDYTDRDIKLGYIKENHTLKSYIGTKIGTHSLVYFGGQAMYRQLISEIPYLYNEYTQTTFDHKYGYVELGVAHKF